MAEGARLVALCYLIHQEIRHADTAQDWQTLTRLAGLLGWSEADLAAEVRNAADAYQVDQGRGLVAAAFADVPAG